MSDTLRCQGCGKPSDRTRSVAVADKPLRLCRRCQAKLRAKQKRSAIPYTPFDPATLQPVTEADLERLRYAPDDWPNDICAAIEWQKP